MTVSVDCGPALNVGFPILLQTYLEILPHFKEVYIFEWTSYFHSEWPLPSQSQAPECWLCNSPWKQSSRCSQDETRTDSSPTFTPFTFSMCSASFASTFLSRPGSDRWSFDLRYRTWSVRRVMTKRVPRAIFDRDWEDTWASIHISERLHCLRLTRESFKSFVLRQRDDHVSSFRPSITTFRVTAEYQASNEHSSIVSCLLTSSS